MQLKIYLFSCLLLFSCTGKNNETASGSPDYIVVEYPKTDLKNFRKDNEGYMILFNGESTIGWRGYGRDYLPPKWKIIDNCLVLTQDDQERSDIIFNRYFKNFELELEWMVKKEGNSGVFYLVREIKAKDPITNEYKLQPIFISAPEYQILDNDNNPDRKLGKEGNRQSGSLYDMIPADPQTANKYGEWNKTKISVNKGNVMHWLNGIKVVEYSFKGQEWIDLLQSGKFGQTKWPLAYELMKNCGGEKHEGYIGLQDHGSEIWFRDIRIKPSD